MARTGSVARLLAACCLVCAAAAPAQEKERQPTAEEASLRALPRLFKNLTRSVALFAEGDAEVEVHCAKLGVDGADFAALEGLKAGEVLAVTGGAATKLRTSADLSFGGVELRAGNVAADFPGLYSLWLKRSQDGWSLLFNDEADVWGTQRDPRRDTAEIALAHHETEEIADEMSVKVRKEEGRGVLVLAWGRHRWETPFEIVSGG